MKMALSFNTKPQNEILIRSIFDVNNKRRSPQGNPPPPPPRSESHTPSRDKNTHGEQQF